MSIVLLLDLDFHTEDAYSYIMSSAASVELEPMDIHLSENALGKLRESADARGVGFSNFLGKAWDERICVPRLQELMADPEKARFAFDLPPNHELSGILLLDSNKNIKKEAGDLKIPDALFMESDPTDPSFVTLRACDFKFNLSMATYAQVNPKTLIELLNQSPSTREKIQILLDQLSHTGKLDAVIRIRDVSASQQAGKPFLTLDDTDKVRVETGRFISAQTHENDVYFKSQDARIKKIKADVVYRMQLDEEHTSNLLAGHPGQENSETAKKLNFAYTLNHMDQQVMQARAAAAMKGLGYTAGQLADFLQSIN